MNIVRLYAEKKEGFNTEAVRLLADISESLNITGIENLRILHRYDVEGLSDEEIDEAKKIIFSEPNTDNMYEEDFPKTEDEKVFGVEYLPGQYDQRADSAVQCASLITMGKNCYVSYAKIYVLKGNISGADLEKIQKYLINPVDSRLAELDKPESIIQEFDPPEDVKLISDFTIMTDSELEKFLQDMGFAMSLEDLKFCQAYFRDTEKRSPSETELKVIDTYWSDHCRHTTFLTKINDIEIEDGPYKAPIEDAYNMYLDCKKEVYGENMRATTLMDMAVMGMKALKKRGILDNLDESEEINACSVNIKVDVDGKDEDWLLMFKNETHNHPTEIEPFGGAATCLGGAIRDPLSGRSYVYQAMRVTGAADPRKPLDETLEGKLPQRKITREAAKGYSSYGNQIGLATGQVTEIYHEGFVAKRMEVGAVLGAAKKELVIRDVPQDGDVVILVGGKTGRDGCGGATGSSKEHTLESVEKCGAEVQKGNAPVERKLQRLFRNPEVSKMIKRCNDFGAGGVSVAIGELAAGLTIDLDSVPKKYEGLDGTELAISESQERMAVVVNAEDAEDFMDYAAAENLESTVVAVVTENRRLRMNWQGKYIVDISRDFLDTNGVQQETDVKVKSPEKLDIFESHKVEGSVKDKWIETVSGLNCASQKGLSEMFDSTIGANTILMPFGGKYQLTPVEAMAAKIPVLNGETTTASLMSFGYNPQISELSPFHGAAYAVVESLSKIVAAGGDYKKARLSFQEYFEKLGKNKESWGKPFAALLGGFKAQMEMGTAAIGGKDSMSGTFMDMNVPPTLISFAVDHTKMENIISPEFKEAGNKIVFVECKRDKCNLVDFEYLKKVYDLVHTMILNGSCISASTVKSGGICEAVSKMALGNKIGADLWENDKIDYFEPMYGSFVLELKGKVLDFMGLDAVILGETIIEEEIRVRGEKISLDELENAWMGTLEHIFPTKTKEEDIKIDIPYYHLKDRIFAKPIGAKPKVIIPVFPGTNCEYETARQFEKAGANVETFVMRNLTAFDLNYSIKTLAEKINQSQIIMIPGGFSAGDEPEGSGKFIAAVFRNPYIKEATMNLLKDRDGLMLGICNGFQALIKLGLVPYGEIRQLDETSPTLTYNTIGRHVSLMVDTKIISDKSPWLWGTKPGEIYTIPVSHGEGRFVADAEMLNTLKENGQIAACYVDKNGDPTMDVKYNPNGSYMSIEAITSPDGRILGKMGHSERFSKGTYKNIEGNVDQKIFESGVNYFK